MGDTKNRKSLNPCNESIPGKNLQHREDCQRKNVMEAVFVLQDSENRWGGVRDPASHSLGAVPYSIMASHNK